MISISKKIKTHSALTCTIFALLLSSCKEKKEEQNLIDSTEITTPKVEIIDNIDSFLSFQNKPNSIFIDVNFEDIIQLQEFSYFKDSLGVSYFVFEIKDDNSKIDINKYRMNLRITPFDNQNDLLREDSKKSNLNYDSWFSDLKIKSNDNTQYIVFSVKTVVSKFEKVELLLYDKQLKKFIENKVDVYYEFEKYLTSSTKLNSHKINGVLGREFPVNNFNAYVNEDSNGFYIAYKLTDVVPKERFTKKRLLVKIFPVDGFKDLLREDSLKKNSLSDSWYFDIQIKEYKNNQFIWAYIPTKIIDLNKIEAYIYDENQKRQVGLPVVLNDISLDFNN